MNADKVKEENCKIPFTKIGKQPSKLPSCVLFHCVIRTRKPSADEEKGGFELLEKGEFNLFQG